MAFRGILASSRQAALRRSVMRSASNINSMNSGSSGVRPLLFRRNFAVGPKDGALKPVYDTLMKNNTTYIFTIVAAAAVAGVAFNEGVDMIWETANRGKLYHHIDWSVFAEEDEDDDDDDDDEDDD